MPRWRGTTVADVELDIAGDGAFEDPGELDSLLGFDRGYWSSFNPFCKLVYGDTQVGEAPGRLFEWPNQVEPPDREGPRDGDHLESLG